MERLTSQWQSIKRVRVSSAVTNVHPLWDIFSWSSLCFVPSPQKSAESPCPCFRPGSPPSLPYASLRSISSVLVLVWNFVRRLCYPYVFCFPPPLVLIRSLMRRRQGPGWGECGLERSMLVAMFLASVGLNWTYWAWRRNRRPGEALLVVCDLNAINDYQLTPMTIDKS